MAICQHPGHREQLRARRFLRSLAPPVGSMRNRLIIGQKPFTCSMICSHLVNTSSQIGTVQDSYLALSYPVKSPLATLPASNSFPFCTNPLSIRDSVSRTDFALSRHSPLSSNSFIYRFYAKSLSISFVYRIYANHRGVPLKKEKMNATQPRIINEPASTATPRCQYRSLAAAGVPPNPENSASPATLSTFKMNTCKSVSKQRTLSSFRMNTYAKTRGGAPP